MTSTTGTKKTTTVSSNTKAIPAVIISVTFKSY